MFLRVVVATFLLGIAAFIQIKGAMTLSDESIRSVFLIIIVIYFLSILYVFLEKWVKGRPTNVQMQIICDITMVTALVYVTGGVQSVYSVLYQLIIIYAAIFLGRRGGLIAASAASIFYGLLLNFEFYGLLTSFGAASVYDYSAGYVLSRIFIHIVSFYIVALLVSWVVEQEKKSRTLLTKKENEFDQLDLLHKGIIEHINAGIITIDLSGNIKSFNRAAEEISGFKFSQVKGKSVNVVIPGFSDILRKMKVTDSSTSHTERGEIDYTNRQGQGLIIGFSVSFLLNSRNEKIGDIVIFQDLTATKQMEKEVERSKNLALIGEMAAGLTHEIRNPLTAMSGSIQLLKSSLRLSETDQRLMQIVLRGRNQLEKLVSNFLLLARPNPGEREAVNINALVDEVIETIQSDEAWNENIRVDKNIAIDNSIFANKTELKQMLWNIILNSIQAMPNGGVLTMTVKEANGENDESHLRITVRDNGCGIGENTKDKIFTPFFTTKDTGTGLGLAVVNRIVGSHGGEIKIESEAEKGTTCTILLPQSK